MDITEIRKQPHLSASAIGDYLDCSLMYKFGRVDKIVYEVKSDALEFGSAIHKALSDFHQEKMIGNKLPIHDLHQLFENYWKTGAEGKEIQYKEGKNFETLLLEGKELLSTYYQKVPNDNFKVLALEEPFAFRLDNLPVPIIGFIDLIEEDESGTIIIVDFKTSSKAYSIDDVDKSLQLLIYQMAAKANGYRDREILLRFDCLIKTKVPKFEQYYTTRTEMDERRAVKKILKVWEGISKGVFIPNDGHWKCNGCSYRKHCEEWFTRETND